MLAISKLEAYHIVVITDPFKQPAQEANRNIPGDRVVKSLLLALRIFGSLLLGILLLIFLYMGFGPGPISPYNLDLLHKVGEDTFLALIPTAIAISLLHWLATKHNPFTNTQSGAIVAVSPALPLYRQNRLARIGAVAILLAIAVLIWASTFGHGEPFTSASKILLALGIVLVVVPAFHRR